MFISLRIREGRLGRAWLAIREDELAASMMGVPLMRTKLAAYAVGAFFGGMGGAAYAVGIEAVIPDRFDFAISITVLAMVVLGGMGNVWGVTIGALLRRLGEQHRAGAGRRGGQRRARQRTSTSRPGTSASSALILVLMMLFRREGMLARDPDPAGAEGTRARRAGVCRRRPGRGGTSEHHEPGSQATPARRRAEPVRRLHHHPVRRSGRRRTTSASPSRNGRSSA